MFELGVITDEIDQDLDHALDVAVAWGLRWVELRSAWGTNIVDLDEAAVRRVQEAVAARGLRVVAIGSPCFKCALPGFLVVQRGDTFFAGERDYAAHLDLLKRAAELAHRFGTDLVRIFSFWTVPDLDAAWGALVDHFDPILQSAEREHVLLALENEHVCNIATGAQTRRFLDAVPSPRLRALWDPGNAYAAGETAYPDGYAAVRGTIVHVHLKDTRRVPGGKGYEWQPVGGGDIDLTGNLRALRDDGYRGVVSLETHYRPPSGSKEEGSRESFAGLQRLVTVLRS